MRRWAFITGAAAMLFAGWAGSTLAARETTSSVCPATCPESSMYRGATSGCPYLESHSGCPGHTTAKSTSNRI